MRMIRASNLCTKTGAMQIAPVLFCLVIAVSCSTKTKQIFFDIQPPSAEELAERAQQDEAEREATLDALETQQTDTKSIFPVANDDNQPRPPIEGILDWETALEMLPKDYKKKADWSAALEQGVIRPRSGADPLSAYAAIFQWDFIIEAEKPKNEAYFPHSAHTRWLSCKNCHTAIFPYKRNPATMKEMKNGASCGTCHGKKNVAFSLSQCKRCHLNK
jgi:c(7)-type cytochrome triheme protein